MAKIIGIGGMFLKSEDPEKLYKWYEKWLGLNIKNQPGVTFHVKNLPQECYSVLSFFPLQTDYFSPSKKDFMLNLIVDDVRQAIEQVREGGAEIAGEIESYEYGKFGWFIDPDGNKIELWEANRNGDTS